jgi:hypothetical protein
VTLGAPQDLEDVPMLCGDHSFNFDSLVTHRVTLARGGAT